MSGTEPTPPSAQSKPSVIGKLRKKERIFAKKLAAGENKTEAVIQAGYNVGSRANAAALGSTMGKKPDIKAYVSELLEKHQLSQDRLIAKNSDLLDAVDERGNPVHEVQRRAMEAGYKLHQMPGFGRDVQIHAHQHNHFIEEIYEDLDNGVIDG